MQLTYRNKADKLHIDYAANLEEIVGKNGSVVIDYKYDKNIHTDSQFLQETMDKSDEQIVLITDGGYDGQDNISLAKEKNVKLVTTALIGKEAPDVLADFVFNDDGIAVLERKVQTLKIEGSGETARAEASEGVEYDYPTFHLSMDCFWAEVTAGHLELKEAEAAKWLTKDQLDSVAWLPADVTLIEKIRRNMEN